MSEKVNSLTAIAALMNLIQAMWIHVSIRNPFVFNTITAGVNH